MWHSRQQFRTMDRGIWRRRSSCNYWQLINAHIWKCIYHIFNWTAAQTHTHTHTHTHTKHTQHIKRAHVYPYHHHALSLFFGLAYVVDEATAHLLCVPHGHEHDGFSPGSTGFSRGVRLRCRNGEQRRRGACSLLRKWGARFPVLTGAGRAIKAP